MKSLCLLLCLVSIAGIPLSAVDNNPASKPNIIVILVDDMGYSDLGCYGSEIPTPNLDALAASGLKFTQFYNTSRCCPTRAALLTGLYSHQTGVGNMTENQKEPGYQGHLNDTCVTIAEVLKPAGYFTAMTGKWHVGQEAGVTPWTRGFDRSLNSVAGGFYFSTVKTKRRDAENAILFLNGQRMIGDDPRLPKDWYSSDLWTTYGLKFIDEGLAAKKPFYLHLCYNAPHFPLQAPAEDIAKFRGKYKEGYDKLRVARNAKQIDMGLLSSDWLLSPREGDLKDWDRLSAPEKDRLDNIMAVYAATVYRLDKAIGDLVAGLKKRNVFDNTLIMFMSDNGGNAELGPKGRNIGDPSTGSSEWFCGESWAFLEDTPFRKFKHYSHEGGISSPFIVHWPAGITAHGELRTQVSHVIDIMPTCVAVSGATYPTTFKGNPILPMEGRSLVPAFDNQSTVRDALFWEHDHNAAVRVGDLKLVRIGRTSAWELYDLSKDRTELHNLASKMPEVVKKLAGLWDAWAVRAHVVPYPNGKSLNNTEEQ